MNIHSIPEDINAFLSAQQRIDAIKRFDVNSIKDESLQEVVALAKEMVYLYTTIESSTLSKLPSDTLTRISDEATGNWKLLQSASFYKSKNDIDGKKKDDIIQKIKESCNRAFNLTADVNRCIMVELRELTEQQGVKIENIVKYHATIRHYWFAVALLLMLGSLGFLFYVVGNLDTILTPMFLITRGMVYLMLFSVITFCSKIYNVYRRNYTERLKKILNEFAADMTGNFTQRWVSEHATFLEEMTKKYKTMRYPWLIVAFGLIINVVFFMFYLAEFPGNSNTVFIPMFVFTRVMMLALLGFVTIFCATIYINNDIEILKKTLNKFATDMKKNFAQRGVSEHAVFFEKMAKHHEKSEKRWLSAAFLAMVYGGYFLFTLFDMPESSDTGDVAIFLISRAMMFSLLGFILFFCARNYMAHRHNYVVNKHRQNALQTYQAIIAGAISPTAHDVILEHAAKCIFMPLDTGYIKSMNSTGNPVVETIRNVVKSGDGKE